MYSKIIVKISLILFVVLGLSECHNYVPEQVHLSLAANGYDMIVTWVTLDAFNQSRVRYGTKQLNLKANGTHEIFTNNGFKRRTEQFHRVLLTNLEPNTIYRYRCGGRPYWSKIYFFKTFPRGSDWSPNFAIYGDLGLQDGYSIPHLQEEAPRGIYDVILHVGDIAYDFHEHDGRQGDAFMREIEPIAAYVPYMVNPGNHENAYNFSHYKHHFTMPGDNQGLYYSINIGPVHLLSFSSEFYYYVKPGPDHWYGMASVEMQYKWIIEDLQEANKHRDKQPWIIVMAHRPMYCTSTDKLGDDCTKIRTRTRVGIDSQYGLEEVFFKYGVDIEIWAHEHTYERFYPMYNYRMPNMKPFEDPFINPRAPVHVLTGSAGCREKEDDFKFPSPEYSAFRSRDYGYTRLKVYNRSHAYFEQVSVKEYPIDGFNNLSQLYDSRKVIDRFWIIQYTHGPFAPF